MQFPITFTGAAVLLALASSVVATGTATLVNSCGFDIYYVSISGTAGGMTMLAPGASFSEAYSQEDVGVSIKVAPNDTLSGPITQFEFTWAGGMISYDISNINGNPFASDGMVLTPSTGSSTAYPTCVPVDCPADPSGECAAAYNQPDDTDTMVCGQDTSLTMDICSGGSSKLKRSPATVVRHSHTNRVHARHILKK